jgi:phosphoglycerol transferase MdoB-like AlkP superfamily enzyme
MKERLRIFLYLVAYWISFMVLARVLFLLYNHDYSADLTVTDIGLAILHGIRMDASISGYFLAVCGLLLTASAFTNSRWITWLFTGLTLTLLLFCCIVVVVDMELYRHWGFRMNTTPLMYIGSEAMGSVQLFVYLKLVAIFFALAVPFVAVFYRKIFPRINYLEPARHPLKTALAMLLISALMFLPIRGSFTVAPMNTGFVFFHNSKAFANHSAVNVVWNFLYSVRKGKSSEYPTNFFPAAQTALLTDKLYENGGPALQILRKKEPNVVLLILESFTSAVIEPLGGLPDVSPNMNDLCREGVLFSQVYASGDRTDKGLISILSGYPAQPQTSIIKLPAKTQRLPQLNQFMKDLGYRTSFVYGGDIDFANFRSYLNTSGFDHLTTLDDFPDSLYTSKWGVHDQYMFDQVQRELDTTQGKFFKVILTLSSHEPFDVPMKTFRAGNDEESMFINSCHYTDQCIGKFVSYCKAQPWWDETLLIITADHGHRHPGNRNLSQKERFHIPLLFTGGAVSTDTTIQVIGSQTDIANTLLGQLSQTSKDFLFSKNLLSIGSPPFAAYYFTDGYGFILPHAFMVYDNAGKRFLNVEGATTPDLELSKAYQQRLFTNYNNLDK